MQRTKLTSDRVDPSSTASPTPSRASSSSSWNTTPAKYGGRLPRRSGKSTRARSTPAGDGPRAWSSTTPPCGPLDGATSRKMARKPRRRSTSDGKVERADAATRKATGWETVYRRVETGNLLQLDRCSWIAVELRVSAIVLFEDLRTCSEPSPRRAGGDLFHRRDREVTVS